MASACFTVHMRSKLGRMLTVKGCGIPPIDPPESDTVFHIQQHMYPKQVPIVLPFLGVFTLGGTKAEGIFRVPSDSDAVADLKARLGRCFFRHAQGC